MLLVFDTSTSQIGIGLATDEGELLREFHGTATANERGIHDARLASETEGLLLEVGATAGAISRIGLVIGPGSFTGLRIGLAFAKGLALALDSGIVALTAHEVLGVNASPSTTYIITPGYQPDLVYHSDASSPPAIRAISVQEYLHLHRSLAIAHSLLTPDTRFDTGLTIFETPSLSAMARLTADSKEILRGEFIDSLEPLYLTDFKTGGR